MWAQHLLSGAWCNDCLAHFTHDGVLGIINGRAWKLYSWRMCEIRERGYDGANLSQNRLGEGGGWASCVFINVSGADTWIDVALAVSKAPDQPRSSLISLWRDVISSETGGALQSLGWWQNVNGDCAITEIEMLVLYVSGWMKPFQEFEDWPVILFLRTSIASSHLIGRRSVVTDDFVRESKAIQMWLDLE